MNTMNSVAMFVGYAMLAALFLAFIAGFVWLFYSELTRENEAIRMSAEAQKKKQEDRERAQKLMDESYELGN